MKVFISTNHTFIEKLATPRSFGWPLILSGFFGELPGGLFRGPPGGSLGGPMGRSYERFPSGLLCRFPSGPSCRSHGRPFSTDWPMRPMSGPMRPLCVHMYWIHV
jgi:hypothetical protein